MAKNPYPSEVADRYIVRFPEGMKDELKERAAENGRSLNAEIIQRLGASLATDGMTGADFVGILNDQSFNAEKILDLLQEATFRMENLMSAVTTVEDVDAND